jgi:hypothetical protein
MLGHGHGPDHYVSIVRISPFNLPDERRRYVVIKAYYDGANKSHEPGYLTLAGLAASESLWPEFEAKWGSVLDRHGLKWWHTTDAMNTHPGARRDFLKSETDTWDLSMALRAMDDLHAVIGRFWEERWQQGFQLFTCSIDLAAYREALRRNKFLRSAEAICVNKCVGTLKMDTDKTALLYFDRGEAFMKEVEQVWRRDLKKPKLRWPQRFKCIAPLDSRDSRPIQAADLLAWKVNLNCRLATEKGVSFTNLWNRVHAYYGLEEIEERYTAETERKRAEGIRRAGRKTRETGLLEEEERSGHDPNA